MGAGGRGGEIDIRPFVSADQPAVRALVLAGLGDHFGVIDEGRNPDLDDIAASYLDRGDLFLVAEIDGALAGTGALIAEGPGVGRLVRMSVAADCRRRGVGRALVAALVGAAKARGQTRLVLETNDDWADAIGLYFASGFAETHRANGDVHFARDL